MKRAVKFSLYLLLAWSLFSFFACSQATRTQSNFEGTSTKDDFKDIEVRFAGRGFQSVYENGRTSFIMEAVSSKQSYAEVKVTVGQAGLHVKIKGKKATQSGDNALEFVNKLKLSTGTNLIPILVYGEDEGRGRSFELQIVRKEAEGALRLTHLKALYDSLSGSAVESDDFVDELPFNGIYERRIGCKNDYFKLEVGSPELEAQLIEVNGVKIEAESSATEHKTYRIPLTSTDATPVDITVFDKDKGVSCAFHLSFRPLTSDEKEETDLSEVILTTEDGMIFDFSKLDISDIKPYKKGSASTKFYTIESIFKLKTLLASPFNGTKPTLSIKPKVEGAKVELAAIWDEVDHDQTSRSGLNFGKNLGWDDSINFDNYDAIGQSFFVLKGPDTDSEYKFTPYDAKKFDFLIKVTSPDGSKVKYHEVKYSFPFGGAVIFTVEPFKAVIKRTGSDVETRATVVKADEEEGVFNVYVPRDTLSVQLVADDRYSVNFATGYRKNYDEIWDYRFYLSVDDGAFSRTHPAKGSGEKNYKELFLTSSVGHEEHKLSVVSYQDGELKDGKFVDEFGNEKGVIKVQSDFLFKFIKEDRVVAPSLSVLKIEGTPTTASSSTVQGKIWPVMEFRPSVHEYKMALPERDMTYKLKMLKTDPEAIITVDGVELSDTTNKEVFTQQVMSSGGFDTLINGNNDTVEFYSYELKAADYYESGKLKPCVIHIGVRKGDAYREYSLEILPVNPDENDLKIHVIDSNGGSVRSGSKILFREHVPNRELEVTSDGKLAESQFTELGTTGADGMLSGKGHLKAGRYYDIYALGDDSFAIADSMVEHYYVSGMPNEILNISQYSLVQGAGADYHGNGTKPVRGNCPVRIRKQLKAGVYGTPSAQYNDGVHFFFRQQKVSSGGLGGLGGGGGSFELKPINLTCGDAHIKMADADGGALTDMQVWFDIRSGNSVEPVSWGPEGVMVAFGNPALAFGYSIPFTHYDVDGKISMDESAVKQQSAMRWDFPTGVYDLVLVAYDVAGNRLERHQMVSVESAHMNEGVNPGDKGDKDVRKVTMENFRIIMFRWPVKMNVFENPSYFEKLFGMPWVEYVPPEGQGNIVKNPSSCIVMARCSIQDAVGPVKISGVDLYRRCVDDGTDFRKVASTIPPIKAPYFGAMDADYSLEEGKTYQYKLIAFIDEGNAVESEYLAEIKVPPACMYFLDRIKVNGQGGGVKDGAIYKYNANKVDKNIPILKTKKYDSGTPEKDREHIKIDYSARLSTSALWNKDDADEIEAGITLFTRGNNPVFASKFVIAFSDEGDEELYMYIPDSGRYLKLEELIERGFISRNTQVSDLVEFNKETCRLTVKDAYLRIEVINWAQYYNSGKKFNYEAGNTYYWDIVSFGRHPLGGNVSALTFLKGFKAKKKNAPLEKYLDEDGDEKVAATYLSFGNGDSDGGNSINGRCRFTVIEE